MNLALSARTLGALLLLPSLSFSQESVLYHPSDIQALQSSAAKGDAVAERKLAEAYDKGVGVDQNDQLAANLYRKAADQGDAEAQNKLGVMYSLGRGVEKSNEDAVRWYHASAKKGYAPAMFNLGAAYYNGDGVPSDLDMAYAWFLLSQEAGNSAAKGAVTRTAQEMKPIIKADALEHVGAMYLKGDEVPQDSSAGLRWYNEAARQSDSAKMALANMLIAGKSVPQDFPSAMNLCRQAADDRFAAGQYCVGYLYENGFGVEKNLIEATKWYELAATGIVPRVRSRAYLRLGDIYSVGDGMSVDRVEASFFFFQAYTSGASEAKTKYQALWPQLSGDEIKKLKGKLRERHLDPKKVFSMMQGQ
ncbi:MAG TPA: tetratricopeptide repeat protein [Candidatus Binatus sp.]|jgi:TPR repeat protein|nr:tetratricopeptide repeat protein [Candidatus Binatus sp.]